MARLIPSPRRILTLGELNRGTGRVVAITDKESVVDDGSTAVGLYIFSRRAAAWERIHGDIRTGVSQVKATAQIFLSYAREDEEKVGNLYQYSFIQSRPPALQQRCNQLHQIVEFGNLNLAESRGG